MDDIECVNIKRNELRMKNSEMNMKSADDCITVTIRRRDPHAVKKPIGAIVMQTIMLIVQYFDIMSDAVSTRQKVVAQNTMVGRIKRNFKKMHQTLDLSLVSDIYLKKKIDAIEPFWLYIQEEYKKEIINELNIHRQRQKEEERNRKEYIWYLQYKIEQFEEEREELSPKLTNLKCEFEYVDRKLTKLTKQNEELKKPIKMSKKEKDEIKKEHEMNLILEMKDKYEGLRRSNKIFNEQLAKERVDLENLKNKGKVQNPEPEPQTPAPANNNDNGHGFLTRKCIAFKRFFMKKFNRRN